MSGSNSSYIECMAGPYGQAAAVLLIASIPAYISGIIWFAINSNSICKGFSTELKEILDFAEVATVTQPATYDSHTGEYFCLWGLIKVTSEQLMSLAQWQTALASSGQEEVFNINNYIVGNDVGYDLQCDTSNNKTIRYMTTGEVDSSRHQCTSNWYNPGATVDGQNVWWKGAWPGVLLGYVLIATLISECACGFPITKKIDELIRSCLRNVSDCAHKAVSSCSYFSSPLSEEDYTRFDDDGLSAANNSVDDDAEKGESHHQGPNI